MGGGQRTSLSTSEARRSSWELRVEEVVGASSSSKSLTLLTMGSFLWMSSGRGLNDNLLISSSHAESRPLLSDICPSAPKIIPNFEKQQLDFSHSDRQNNENKFKKLRKKRKEKHKSTKLTIWGYLLLLSRVGFLLCSDPAIVAVSIRVVLYFYSLGFCIQIILLRERERERELGLQVWTGI